MHNPHNEPGLLKKFSKRIEDADYLFRYLSSRKKKSFYIGWHGHGNLGDEILLLALKKLLEEDMALYEKNWWWVKNIVTFDCILLGGGTLINQQPFFLKLLKKMNGRRRVVFGSGVKNPEYWKDIPGAYTEIDDWVRELNGVDYLGVRGPISKKLLEDWGVKREIKIIGDPALYLLREEVLRKQRKRVLGINIGFTNGLLWGGDDIEFFEALMDELLVLGQKGWAFKFFPVFYRDIDFMKRAMKILKDYPVDYVSNYLDPDHVMNELEQVDLFLGEKLHSVVIALCANTPSIMLEYRPKCRDFMMSLGLDRFNIRTDQIERGTIFELVESIYETLESTQMEAHEKCRAIKDRLVTEAKIVIEMLG